MHLANRPATFDGCHRLDRSLVIAHADRRRPLPPCAAATLEAPRPALRQSAEGLSRAVVIGGSVAGLLSAAAASPFFDEVIVLERDPPMPPRSDKPQADGAEYKATARSRNGSPQFMHGHIYLKRGWEVANGFLPGLEEAALKGGAVNVNAMRDAKHVTNGLTLGPTKDADCDLSWIQATRFVAERAFRERLLALYGNVQLRSGCWVSSLEHGDGDARGAVTGVALKGGEVLDADLVVDASGRLSRVQSWLTDGGYETPRSVEVNPRVGYAGVLCSVPEEVVRQLGWKCLYVKPVAPDTRGVVAMLIEGGRMQIGGIGYGGDYPPGDLPGLLEFLDSLHVPELTNLMRHATPLFDPISYKGATNKRRFYEEVALPRNLVVLGDAVCTFNPAYGQGMTTAALHAQALQKQLQSCAQDAAAPLRLAQLGNISAKAQKDIADVSAFCFQLATSEDLKFPTTKGERTNSPMQRFLADYIQDIIKCSVKSPELAMVFTRVGHMVSPPTALFAPQVLGKVLLYRMQRFFRRLTPQQDPAPEPSYG